MASIASLQAQQTKAQAAFDTLNARLEELNKNARLTTAQISATQNQISTLMAKLRSAKTPKERIDTQNAITAAQKSLIGLQSSLRAIQKDIIIVNSDLRKRRAALDSANATLTLALANPPPIFKRALLIGINYENTPYELEGCINDVVNMKTQLETFFPDLKDITLMTDATPVKPTKANILAGIDALVSGLKKGENIMFHFSGHGGHVVDKNGDEVSGYDSCIYPCNGDELEIISDDELRTALASRVPAGSKCLVILDACHSGTAVDLRYLWQTSANGGLSYKEDQHYDKTAGDVLFLSAAKDDQTAADTADENRRPCGALTWALLDTWRTYGPAIKTKYLLWDVRNFLKARGYSQIPQLSTGRYIDLQNVFDLNG